MVSYGEANLVVSLFFRLPNVSPVVRCVEVVQEDQGPGAGLRQEVSKRAPDASGGRVHRGLPSALRARTRFTYRENKA